jgi:hypothetical protein
MKKLLFILLLIPLNLFAPTSGVLSVVEGESIQPYKRLIYAIGVVECSLDTLAYNPIEDAVGYFQIRPIRLEDFNKRKGKSYKLTDMYDYDKAEEVFLSYTDPYYTEEYIARLWNGGPDGMRKASTLKYWRKIKAIL